MRIYFDFDETKLTNVKLYGELRPIKYYIKELDCADKYGHVESVD